MYLWITSEEQRNKLRDRERRIISDWERNTERKQRHIIVEKIYTKQRQEK